MFTQVQNFHASIHHVYPDSALRHKTEQHPSELQQRRESVFQTSTWLTVGASFLSIQNMPRTVCRQGQASFGPLRFISRIHGVLLQISGVLV